MNLPISEYMTSSSGSSTFGVEVKPVEGLVHLNFSANWRRKTNTCLYMYIRVSQKEINSPMILFHFFTKNNEVNSFQ